MNLLIYYQLPGNECINILKSTGVIIDKSVLDAFHIIHFTWKDSVAYLPHAKTVEPQKPQNTHAAIELRVFIAHC
jgi:hypothetical protein